MKYIYHSVPLEEYVRLFVAGEELGGKVAVILKDGSLSFGYALPWQGGLHIDHHRQGLSYKKGDITHVLIRVEPNN